MPIIDQAAQSERHQALKGMLEERRQEILDKLRTIREAMPDQRLDVQDAEEQAVTDFAKDMEFALVQMKADTLGRIDEAMRRLEAGTYGQCAECGTEIPAARLKALPFAVLCRDCQAQEEMRAAEENKAVMRALPALEG
ncbi:MAG: conjugal transfer protein TraR [Acidobacteria bacterium]|nr:MAG: conjugal transfer protein TraR [Acidobacteriota bacterium]